MNWKAGLLVLFTILILSGCATMPIGPTVSVMPSPGKPFEVFMADDGVCREWARHQIGEHHQAKPPMKTWPPERSSERW
jgi:hypothetical protein